MSLGIRQTPFVSQVASKIVPPHDEAKSLHKLLEMVVMNHQKYAITFEQGLENKLICTLTKDNCIHGKIPVIATDNFPRTSSDFENPYAFTFYPNPRVLVFGSSGLQGGVNDELTTLLQQSEGKMAGVIARRLPEGTYTNVNVSTREYSFGGTEPKSARVISLSMTPGGVAAGFFCALFAGLGLMSDQDYTSAVNKDQLQEQLLGKICSDQTNGVPVDQIVKAYKLCTHIDLFIAQDQSGIEISFRRSDVIDVTYSIAKTAGALLPHIIAFVIAKTAKK